ncbi:hypothetical protein Q667_15590 [Marinobacter sp. C1S70]|nr:hypothetical protein Q667_15590 [Marinobacter sp. C1S70]
MPDDLVDDLLNSENSSRRLVNCEDRVFYGGADFCAMDLDDAPGLASHRHNTLYYNPDQKYEPPLKADGTSYPNIDFYKAPLDGYSVDSTVNLNTEYRALMDDYYYYGRYYYNVWWGETYDNIYGFTISPDGNAGSAFINRYDTDCGDPTSVSCFDYKAIPIDDRSETDEYQRQNFANWFSYYRTRMMASKAGIGKAFSAELSEDFRLGWGEINREKNTVDDAASVRAIRAGVRRFGDVKSNFFTWLYGREPDGATPLQRALEGAGQYYEKSGRAWADDPSQAVNKNSNPMRECRQSYTILMTDGYYNVGSDYNPDLTTFSDDTDGDKIETGLNAPYQYKPKAPYSDGYSGRVSLADVAMHYWKRDLRTDVDNYVPTIDATETKPGNPAFWQHMVTYGVGLGVSGSIDPDDAFKAALEGTSVDWWAGSDNEDKINDLLHAGVNSRGGFFSAADPATFSSELVEVLKDATARAGSATGLDFSITSFKEGSLLFSASFDPSGWRGDVKAVELLATEEGEPVIPGEDDEADGWSARDKLDSRDLAANDRDIITYDGGRGRPFTWSNLTTAQKQDLQTGDNTLAEDRLSYLRGDRSFEADLDNFRKRSSRLGTIVNSTPRYVGVPDSEWPNSAAFGDGKYSLYRTSMKDRTPVVYAGSNDGMLHGFKATTSDDGGGEELLAYVPSFVFSDQAGQGLHYLTQPEYQHRYYVDLESRVTDVHIKGRNVAGGVSDAKWRTILLSGGRAGPKGLFALDITDPDSFSEENASSLVLWEFTHEKLGNLVQPPVVSMADWGNGDYRWTAFVPSGYNSGSTGFFMLDIEGGVDGSWGADDYKYIEFDSSGSGLSPLTVIDVTSDYIADRVYAGDLEGNIWVAERTSKGWTSSYVQGNTPVAYFEASRPITAAPTIGPASAEGNGPNLMIMFGTGRYLETGDVTSTADEFFYGVLEQSNAKVPLGVSNLVEREIKTKTGQVDGVTQLIRYAEGDPIDYKSKDGWYVELPTTGERVITNGVIRGQYAYVSTLIPSADPCMGGGDGWIMAFDMQEGSVGLDNDPDALGAFEDSTQDAMGYKVEGVPSQLKVWGEFLAYDCAGCGARLDALPPFGLALGRKGWRELTQ